MNYILFIKIIKYYCKIVFNSSSSNFKEIYVKNRSLNKINKIIKNSKRFSNRNLY